MCLAIPARVLEVHGAKAKVDFGGGVTREVNVSLLENVKEGDYVIVHAGFAIQLLDREEAERTLKLWEEILSAGER
ncbi:HypC/HybG/HupF family hydrogenase formation chaperone [Candidatus Bathyarchaeota archaeon]|nr:MAG: HypC/HybG/HupF family hydrogenase formation chaperone [Candidatus Hecatellales archaeon]RLI35790.1 MAG: HypC/HybG/HupF family hydrogenase formation chaperone [Candidatus Bathyarchaeota archaeon]